MKSSVHSNPSPMRWITHAALVLALGMVIARITTTDALRAAFQATPGSQPDPGSPGPSTALVYDLLACLPALLVCLRRVVDANYRLSFRWSHLLLFALAGFAVLSTAWSVDRFAAAVTSAHFFTGACLLWAMSQLVRSPDRFRLVGSLAFGLLLVLSTRTVIYRFIDVPQGIENWNKNKARILKDENISPDSFEAAQFERKIFNGELLAFFTSANSVAAVGVLLFWACVGIGLQKVRDGESKQWLILPAIAVLLLVWILINARSKTSAGTPLVGIAALASVLYLRDRQISPRTIFLGGLGLTVFGMIAVVGHGIYHHGLFAGHFSNSLDFRWKYWVASAGIFREHPLIGVGWSNFFFYYLAHRLPEAAEGVHDPHNFLVRFFVELGLVGGLLSTAWLVRLSWEITCAKNADAQPSGDGTLSVKTVAVIIAIGMLLCIINTTDFSVPLADVLTLMLAPILYVLTLVLGMMASSVRSKNSWLLDDRPAPLVFYCTVTGLGLFLLHNLIDFSWFEAGPMYLFMTMLGASQGITTPVESSDRSFKPALIIGGLGTLGWLAAAFTFVLPVIMAEQSAADADEFIRTVKTSDPSQAIAHFRHAADDLQAACRSVPYNVDYIYRQAEVRQQLGDIAGAQALLTSAKQVAPRQGDAYLLEARMLLRSAHPSAAIIRQDFSDVLNFDPNNIRLHIEYGQALAHLGLMAEAREQYKLALKANDALPAGEPTRLSVEEVTTLNTQARESDRTPRDQQ